MYKSVTTGRGRTPALRLLAAVTVLLILSGCLKTTKLRLSFEGKPDMNAGYACRVRVYQLKAETTFAGVPLDAFWKDGAAPFEADLAAPRAEVTLEPGTTNKGIKIKISKETNFIGAAADFIRPDKNSWRQVLPFSMRKGIIPVTLKKRKELTLIVYADKIEIKT